MNTTCICCQKEIGEHYRVNEFGDVFCDDHCYENYDSDVECMDWKHPYIDDYESIRSNYLDWLDNWESELDLDPEKNNLQYTADKVLDKIDEVYGAYWDYYKAEGDDGVFAWEIYRYLLKFEELQEQILHWRPKNRQVFFYLSLDLNVDDLDENLFDPIDFLKYLYLYRNPQLFEMMKDHTHPYDCVAFYFETQEELEAVVQKLEETFSEEEIYIYYDKAYVCEGECADIEVIDDVDMEELDGWFFCCSCESLYYPGFFTMEELQKEIQECDEILEREGELPFSSYFLRKIKRSCRYHQVEYPDWIGLV